MSRAQTNFSGAAVLDEVDEFFMSAGPVHRTLRNLANRLGEASIDYAVVGGMALALHGFVRPTQDVDVLLSVEGLTRFHDELVGLGYVPASEGAREHFRDTETGVKIEVITAGEYPGDGKPKAVVFPSPAAVAISSGGVHVVGLETLIELKLASGLSAEHRRLRDLADVQQLIETLELPPSLSENLDVSVRDEYNHLWQLAQISRSDSDETPR